MFYTPQKVTKIFFNCFVYLFFGSKNMRKYDHSCQFSEFFAQRLSSLHSRSEVLDVGCLGVSKKTTDVIHLLRRCYFLLPWLSRLGKALFTLIDVETCKKCNLLNKNIDLWVFFFIFLTIHKPKNHVKVFCFTSLCE